MNINATLFGQMITFGLFVWFTMKLVWPPIIKALDERQNTIANGLAAAERGQKDLALAQRQALDELREARAEGHKIIESAQKRGSDMIDEAKRLAHEEGKRLQELAQIEIEQERHHARNALSKEVAALALLSAERILGHEVSDSVNKKIIDDMVSGL